MSRLVVARVAADHRHRLPHAVGLVRLHARPADLAAPAGRWRPGRSRGSSRHPCGTAGRATAAGCRRPSRSFSGVVIAAWRYVADVTISLKNCFTSQPRLAELDGQPVEQLRMRRQLAGDAEVAGWCARGPCRTASCQKRLTVTRAVSGCSGRSSHWAKPRRLRGRSAGQRRQDRRRVGRHLVAALVVLAADRGCSAIAASVRLLHDVGDRAAGT